MCTFDVSFYLEFACYDIDFDIYYTFYIQKEKKPDNVGDIHCIYVFI